MAAASDLVIAALAAAAACGCDRATPLLVCHNANCAGTVDAARDDTMSALADSLALTVDGRAPFDGVEIDLLWHGSEERCLFAHGFDQADATPVPVADAADAVAAYLLGTDEPTWNRELFVLYLELKGEVGPGYRGHEADDVAPHVECAFDAIARVRAAATAAGHRLEAVIDSSEPEMLHAAVDHPGWDGADALLSADFGAPALVSADTHALSDFPSEALDMVAVYPGLVTDAQMEAFRSLGVDLSVWMFTASSEILAAIDALDPAHVVTGEAVLVRRWLER